MTPKAESNPLAELLAMPLDKRIAAVAKDVRSKKDRYAKINAFALADALEVEEPDTPRAGWGFTDYSRKKTLEQHADWIVPVSRLQDYLEGHVSEDRFIELKPKFDRLDSVKRPRFGFLTKKERLIIESAMDAEALENAMHRVASCSVGKGRNALLFEGDIEDDGACIKLRTPYDQRNGDFIDLSNCITEDF